MSLEDLVGENQSFYALVNVSQTDSPLSTYDVLYVAFIFFILGFISIATLIGNFLVIIAVLTTKSLHTITNSFIVSLAVADFLVPIIIQPLSIYMVIFNEWKFGLLICDLWMW